MKHTLQRASVRSGGKLHVPGDQVDLPKDYLISIGELDADGNLTGQAAPAQPEVNTQAILDENETLRTDLEKVTKERDDLKASAGAVVLPEDALKRLVTVDGIGEKLAQKALDALTAKG